jgi:6-phosphogluconolactonase
MPRSHFDLVVAPRTVLAELFARRCAARAAEAMRAGGAFALIVPGGSVARAFLPMLATAELDWGRTDVFWADERVVPSNDPESNYGLGRALFMHGEAARRARFHPMTVAGELDAAAAGYAQLLAEARGRPPAVDVALLGVGEDGHVASIFPRGAALAETSRWVVVVRDAPKPPPQRLTMTPPVFAAARVVCLAALGPSKAKVMPAVLTDAQSTLPAAQVLRGAREAWVLLDEAAAARLSTET